MSDERFKDVVRAAMRAHENEAPTAAEFRAHRPVRPERHRARRIDPLAAAACILALVGALFAINHSGGEKAPIGAPATTTTANPLDCPDTYHQAKPGERVSSWVPSMPQGVDGTARLVPDATPAHVVICAYLHDDRGQLSGTRVIDRGLAHIPAALSWLPRVLAAQEDQRPCTLVSLSTDGDNYLIGLSYQGSAIWVSAPGNHCDGSSNGEFATFTNLRSTADEAYRSGAWPASPNPGDPCTPLMTGRLGQSEAMVPGGFDSVQVCVRTKVNSKDASPGPTVRGARASELAQALNALPTEPFAFSWGCSRPEQLPDTVDAAIFRYPVGPAVVIELMRGCPPEITNGTLQSASAESVLPLIKDLLPQK